MADLINRKAAIDAFEDTTFTKNEISRRLSELPSAKPEWIPVTERLPEIGVFVLISHVGCVSEDFLDIDDDDDLYFWNSGLRLEYEKENIAWMPKPEPYKKEEE